MIGEWDGKERRNSDTRITDIEKNIIVVAADVVHIKDKLENGIFTTVNDIHLNLTKLIPVIDRHTALEKRVEDVFWWLIKIMITFIIGVIIWAVANGWKPAI